MEFDRREILVGALGAVGAAAIPLPATEAPNAVCVCAPVDSCRAVDPGDRYTLTIAGRTTKPLLFGCPANDVRLALQEATGMTWLAIPTEWGHDIRPADEPELVRMGMAHHRKTHNPVA